MSGIADALESIYTTVVFDSRDWSQTKRDAWLYGVVVGWDGPAMREVAGRFGWPPEDVSRLRALHRAFQATRMRQRRATADRATGEVES